jgi:hypothetical protein
MFELIREILKLWILRRTPPVELRRAKLESMAREFMRDASGDSNEARIRESFRLGRVWMSELDGGDAP